jgi:translation elongation factor EF-1alpha
MATGERIGTVVHFFNKISVVVAKLESDLKIGDTVHFHGPHTDFTQKVSSMQVEHEVVTEGAAGDEVAIKVDQRVRKSDALYRPSE